MYSSHTTRRLSTGHTLGKHVPFDRNQYCTTRRFSMEHASVHPNTSYYYAKPSSPLAPSKRYYCASAADDKEKGQSTWTPSGLKSGYPASRDRAVRRYSTGENATPLPWNEVKKSQYGQYNIRRSSLYQVKHSSWDNYPTQDYHPKIPSKIIIKTVDDNAASRSNKEKNAVISKVGKFLSKKVVRSFTKESKTISFSPDDDDCSLGMNSWTPDRSWTKYH